MEKRYSNMNLLEFQEQFKTEEDCRKKLFALRWPDGFECPKCKEKQCYELTDRPLYQCQNCRYQVSVTAGTVMHRTRTPLLKWFWAIFLVSTDKRGISALALSKKIGVSYWVAWTMLQKLRQGMRDRDSNYKLAGVIEMDDAFFGGPQQGGDKRGRGTSKIPVIVEVSTKGKGVGFARMTVVDHVDGKTISKIVRTDIKENQRIKTDGFRTYNVVKEEGHDHRKFSVKPVVPKINLLGTF
jgi:transposase-like protein